MNKEAMIMAPAWLAAWSVRAAMVVPSSRLSVLRPLRRSLRGQ